MGLYQSLREPPILTAIIGAKCSDGIVLVADAKISRINNEKLESTIKKDSWRSDTFSHAIYWSKINF